MRYTKWTVQRAESIMNVLAGLCPDRSRIPGEYGGADIPDDWGREYDLELYVQTFDAAIAFAKEFPDTLWCYGNHDLCYVWNERESGYSWAVQVVGHTPVEKIYRSGSVISCDVFSTYRDGRPIGTQKYPVIDTVEKTLWKEV